MRWLLCSFIFALLNYSRLALAFLTISFTLSRSPLGCCFLGNLSNWYFNTDFQSANSYLGCLFSVIQIIRSDKQKPSEERERGKKMHSRAFGGSGPTRDYTFNELISYSQCLPPQLYRFPSHAPPSNLVTGICLFLASLFCFFAFTNVIVVWNPCVYLSDDIDITSKSTHTLNGQCPLNTDTRVASISTGSQRTRKDLMKCKLSRGCSWWPKRIVLRNGVSMAISFLNYTFASVQIIHFFHFATKSNGYFFALTTHSEEKKIK